MAPAALHDQIHRLVMAHGGFVDANSDQRVVDIGDCHQPGRKWNLKPFQTLRIAATVPFLLMRIGDLLGQLEKLDLEPERILGMLNGIAAQRRVVFITSNSSGVRRPGFSRMLSAMPTLPRSCSGADLNNIEMVPSPSWRTKPGSR